MKSVIRPAAVADIERYWHLIARNNPDAAARFRVAVRTTIEAVAAQPALLGHNLGFRRHAEVRSFRLPPPYGKYLLFFHVHVRHVEFKRLVHGAQHLPRLFRAR